MKISTIFTITPDDVAKSDTLQDSDVGMVAFLVGESYYTFPTEESARECREYLLEVGRIS